RGRVAFVFPIESHDSFAALEVEPIKAWHTVYDRFYSNLTHDIVSRHITTWSKKMRSSSLKKRLKCVSSPGPKHLYVGWESAPGIAELWEDGNPTVRRSQEKEGILYGDKGKHFQGQEQDSFGDEINSVYHGETFGPNVLTLEGTNG
ncbi:hypothetical protein E2I00_017340, partial [Balaenoptera physalus]